MSTIADVVNLLRPSQVYYTGVFTYVYNTSTVTYSIM